MRAWEGTASAKQVAQKPAPAESKKQTEGVATPAESVQDAPGQQTPSPASKFRERATETLRRVGYEPEDVQRFSDAQLRKRVAKAERMLNDSAAMRSELERLRGAGQAPASKEVQNTLQAQGSPALSNASAPVVDLKLAEPFKRLEREVGAEVAAAIYDAVAQPLLQENASLKAQLKQAPPVGGPQDGNEGRAVIEKARAELVGRFPDLSDDDSFVHVARGMQALDQSGVFAHLSNDKAAYAERLMEAAVRALGYDEGGHAQATAPQGAAQRGMVDVPRGRSSAPSQSGPLPAGQDPMLRAMAEAVSARYGRK